MNKLPTISDEDDLEAYADYLKDIVSSNDVLIGKNARIEFIFGNRKEIRFGKILKIDKEHIILKVPKTKNTLYCDAKRVSFIYIFN